MQIIGLTMGFSATVIDVVDAAARTPNFRVDQIAIEGVYNILFFNITLDTPNGVSGSLIRMTGDNLTVLNELTINWYDPDAPADEWLDPLVPNIVGGVAVPDNLIITWTATLLEFILPDGIPFGQPLLIMAEQVPATFFTGTTLLAQLNVQLVDGSGLYKLVDDQAFDTYYDRTDPLAVTNINLKIPDPYVKTGLFNG